MGQRLGWLFFYVLDCSPFFLDSPCLVSICRVAFRVGRFEFDVANALRFHAVSQRQFGGEQKYLLRDFGATHQRGMRARAFEDDKVGAMSIHFQAADNCAMP